MVYSCPRPQRIGEAPEAKRISCGCGGIEIRAPIRYNNRSCKAKSFLGLGLLTDIPGGTKNPSECNMWKHARYSPRGAGRKQQETEVDYVVDLVDSFDFLDH